MQGAAWKGRKHLLWQMILWRGISAVGGVQLLMEYRWDEDIPGRYLLSMLLKCTSSTRGMMIGLTRLIFFTLYVFYTCFIFFFFNF